MSSRIPSSSFRRALLLGALSLATVLLGAAPGVALLLPSTASAGGCAPAQMTTGLLVTSGTVAQNGGLLGQVQHGYGPTSVPVTMDLAGAGIGRLFSAARLVRGSHRIPLRAEYLAPGYVRLLPTSPPQAGEWSVEGLSGGARLRFSGPSTTPALAAPRLSRVRRLSRTFSGPFGRGSSETLVATLRAAPPEGAAGLVAYESSANGAPLLFAGIRGRSNSVPLWSSPGRCALRIPGLRAPNRGESVRFAWVDSLARVSPRSAPVTVR